MNARISTMKMISKLFLPAIILLTCGIMALKADVPPPAYDVFGSIDSELVVPDLLGTLTAVGVLDTPFVPLSYRFFWKRRWWQSLPSPLQGNQSSQTL
jgi:hypothetical protein